MLLWHMIISTPTKCIYWWQGILYVEQTENNLIPPFILQEAGLEVNDIPEINCFGNGATPDDHTIQEI